MNKIKLNLGCASRPLKNYVNVDQDSLSTIRKRYPNLKKIKNLKIYNFNIFKLPYKESTVDEVRADALIEHLTFNEEKIFFYELKRVVKKGGIIRLSTVDFEKTVKEWLKAKDNWIDFHRDDDEAIKNQYWFGTNTYNYKNRWGYFSATIFGSQNGKGQYHKNAYTKKKLQAMCDKLGFKVIKLKDYRWKKDRDYMINLIAKKL